jgi:hypothetical protein
MARSSNVHIDVGDSEHTDVMLAYNFHAAIYVETSICQSTLERAQERSRVAEN